MKAKRIVYKDQARIQLDFPNNSDHVRKLKEIPDCRWSQTLRAWHIPYTAAAFERLKLLFPELDFPGKSGANKNEGTSIAPVQPVVSHSPAGKSKSGVSIFVFGRSIAIKLPKNELDIQFILSFRFSRWDAKKYCWIVPNYAENLNLLKDYFGDRVAELVIH